MIENKNLVSKIFQLLEEYDVLEVTEKNLEYNFINQSDIDSFGILSFITEIEALMKIEFTPEELTDSSIQTVGGLADLIEKKLKIGTKVQ